MTLQFQQQIKNKPTHFVEQIINSLDHHPIANEYYYDHLETIKPLCDWTVASGDKLHTIRADKKDRWHKGNDIHFKAWSGRPYHSTNINFLPITTVTSTQKIEIIYKDIDGLKLEVATVYIDGVWIPGKEVEKLAVNDGFETIEEFFSYFNTTFTGKIIHWTTLKY